MKLHLWINLIGGVLCAATLFVCCLVTLIEHNWQAAMVFAVLYLAITAGVLVHVGWLSES